MSGEELRGDTTKAIEFLKAWEPQGPWTLTAIDPERGDERQRIQTRQFDPRQERGAAEWIESFQNKRNIYFSANRAIRGITKKTKKDAITHALTFHVDVDPIKYKGADPEEAVEHYTLERNRIVQALMAYSPQPTTIIYSGGGYQAFWKLAEPYPVVSEQDIEAIEDRNRTLEGSLGGDNCHNIDRVMRLPGTVNILNAKKREAGRVPELAALLEADWDRLYRLDQFTATPHASRKPRVTPSESLNRQVSHKPRRMPPEWCTRLIANGPDEEGKHSYGGDRSKAVFAVTCALIRAGWEDDDIAETILDANNKISDHVRAQDQPGAYAQRQARKARAKVGTDFAVNDAGKPVSSQYNIRLALLKLGVELSFDEFSRKVMVDGPENRPNRYFDDSEEVFLYLTIDEVFGFRPAKEFFHDVLMNEARHNAHHPVKEYLADLEWDGIERIDSWLTDYAGADDSSYMRAVGALMLLAACRRVRSPGCKFDEIMLFESAQGLDKSSALRVLAVRDEWFSDSLALNADDKAIIEAVTGKWIIETAELKGMRGAAIEHLKAFLARQVDRARLAYGRHVTEAPRQCVFFGTTNSTQYLRDDKNRRFWPVRITRFNIAALLRDRDQLWAEAAMREAQGESIRLDPALYPVAEAEQSKRVVEEPWVGLIERAFGRYETGKVLVEDMWELLGIPAGLRTQEHNSRMGNAMQSLGWERAKLSEGAKKKWHYAKGDERERENRVVITRDDNGKVKVQSWRDGETHPDYDGEPDAEVQLPLGGKAPPDIPF